MAFLGKKRKGGDVAFLKSERAINEGLFHHLVTFSFESAKDKCIKFICDISLCFAWEASTA